MPLLQPGIFSPKMQKVFDQASRLAQYPTTVLIEGETGVGKELVANWIHQASPRRNLPFIKVNCASIPESLLESELFGYERGAFTGAKREGNAGLFEQADKGTLLLDEIGELSPSIQAKLLRVLQDREIRRVGGSWSRVIDVRIVASTNRNLRAAVASGSFREDLYYRLHVGYIYVPPLRQRKEAIAPLIHHFLSEFTQEFGVEKQLSEGVLTVLTQYPYPGNVRELRNILEGIYVSSDTALIGPGCLPDYVRNYSSPPETRSCSAAQRDPANSPDTTLSLKEQVEQFERSVIESALKTHDSVRRAAKSLQLSHTTLLRKMERYHIQS